MFSQFFGNYLIKNNQITTAQMDQILEYQSSHRAKLGLIAVAEGMLTEKQADELNLLQAQQDKRFGDLAVEKGYLTDQDITHLLKLQGNPYLVFIQAMDELHIMNTADAEVRLASFQKENRLSNSDIAALKTCDINNIIPIFTSIDNDYASSLVGLAFRNIVRFVDSNFRFEREVKKATTSAKYIAYQETTGDYNGFLGFTSDDDSLLLFAEGYAKESFKIGRASCRERVLRLV